MGIGLDTSVASADEVQNAQANQNVSPVKVTSKSTNKEAQVDDVFNVMETIKKGLNQGKEWDKDIIPWLKKKDPKITIKKINEMKSNLNGKQEKRATVKKA